MWQKWTKGIDNFFYHYKYHVIAGIAFVLFFGSLLFSVVKGQIENYQERHGTSEYIQVLLFGDFKVGMEDAIIEANLEKMGLQDEIRVQTQYVPTETNAMEDIAAQQKAVAVMASEKPDIYIFDQKQFADYLRSGGFVPLTDFEMEKYESLLVYGSVDENGEEKPFGIEMTNNQLFEHMEIERAEKIAVIRSQSLKIEETKEVLKELSQFNVE